jgi:KDO2-lipid IV(A) lauroyltransferase
MSHASSTRRLRNHSPKARPDAATARFFKRKYSPQGWRKGVRTLRYLLEYAGVRVFIAALRLLGVDRASATSGWLWKHLAPHTRRHQRALQHLGYAFPDKRLEECDALARKMWENLGRVAAEACMIDHILAHPSRIEVISPDIIEAVRAAEGKAVIASMHFGNWELGMWPFTQAGYNSIALYQRIQNPYIDALVHRLRKPVLPGGLYGKAHSTPRQLLKAVRMGNPVGILADLRDMRGLNVPFFNRQAPSTAFPALIARHEGALLIAGRVKRLKGVHFQMEAQIIPVAQTDDRNADIAAATRDVQKKFETWIREAPEQWMWAHQRWGKDH